MKIVLVFVLVLAMSGYAFAAEPQPPKTDRELTLEKQLVDTELLLLQYQIKDLLDQQKKLAAELEKRKPPEKK